MAVRWVILEHFDGKAVPRRMVELIPPAPPGFQERMGSPVLRAPRWSNSICRGLRVGAGMVASRDPPAPCRPYRKGWGSSPSRSSRIIRSSPVTSQWMRETGIIPEAFSSSKN